MTKLKPEDLPKIQERMRSVTNLREGAGAVKITVHMGTCGIASGARPVLAAFLDCIDREKAVDIVLTTTGCAGLCSQEPMATVEMKGEAPVKYVELNEEKAVRIFNEHVRGGNVIAEYALGTGSERVV